MAKHSIEITVDLDGIISSEVHGILGNGCELESKWIDDLGKMLEHKKTADAGKTKKAVLVKKVSH